MFPPAGLDLDRLLAVPKVLRVLEAYRLGRVGLGHAGAEGLDLERRLAVVLRRVEVVLDRDLDLIAFHQRARQGTPVHGDPTLVVIRFLQILAVAGVGVDDGDRSRIDQPRMFGPLPFRGREEHEHGAGDVRRLADRDAERHLALALHRGLGTPIVRVEAAELPSLFWLCKSQQSVVFSAMPRYATLISASVPMSSTSGQVTVYHSPSFTVCVLGTGAAAEAKPAQPASPARRRLHFGKSVCARNSWRYSLRKLAGDARKTDRSIISPIRSQFHVAPESDNSCESGQPRAASA